MADTDATELQGDGKALGRGKRRKKRKSAAAGAKLLRRR
jgi:hypothetical protein